MESEVEVIRGWLARVFHKVEGEEVEVTNFCFDTIQGGEEEDLPRNSFVATRNMAILKRVKVELVVGNGEKFYSLVVKVLPTEDSERHTVRQKFRQVVRFSKEVEVYTGVVHAMMRVAKGLDIFPPVARPFHGQVDGLNDCLVLEDLEPDGFLPLPTSPAPISLLAHVHAMLRALADWHALSLRLAVNGDLATAWPFAVEGEAFAHRFRAWVAPVLDSLLQHIRWGGTRRSSLREVEAKLATKVDLMLWALVKLRAPPPKGPAVLAHGSPLLHRGLYRYEAGRPVECRLVGLSSVGLGSQAGDLASLLAPCLGRSAHACLPPLLLYHSHLTRAAHILGLTDTGPSLQELVHQYRDGREAGLWLSCSAAVASQLVQGLHGDCSSVHITQFLREAEENCTCIRHQKPTGRVDQEQGGQDGELEVNLVKARDEVFPEGKEALSLHGLMAKLVAHRKTSLPTDGSSPPGSLHCRSLI